MDPVVAELIAQLVRNGTLSQSDIGEITGRLIRAGHEVEAHNVNVSWVEAHSATLAEQADQRRARFRVIETDEG